MKIQKPGSCICHLEQCWWPPRSSSTAPGIRGGRELGMICWNSSAKLIFTAVLGERRKWGKVGGKKKVQPYSCCNTEKNPTTSAELLLSRPGQHLLQLFPVLFPAQSSFPNCRCFWFLFFVSALDNSSRSEDTWTSPFNRSFPSLLLVCFYLLRRFSVLLRLCLSHLGSKLPLVASMANFQLWEKDLNIFE